MKHLAILLSLVAASISATAQTVPINLNTWTQEGPPGNGNWTVAPDGNSVLQSINGNPTFFVSPTTFLNSTFQGKFGVETTSDDDYIGFVLFEGANDTDPFILFDWKQLLQDGSQPGFTLARVTGGASSIPFGNHGTDATNYDVLATNLGTGWADNTVYDFTLTYTSNQLKVDIAGGSFGAGGATIFDLPGTYPEARFGFYNFSQQAVRYQGFTQRALPPPVNGVPEPGATLGLLSLSLLGLGVGKRYFAS